LLAFALASAMGHYLPGILRAYGDRSLFCRFRARLIAVPLFLFGLTSALAYYNYDFIFLIVGVWGAWHWTMQIYGFARIYEAKSPAVPALLDRALCILWFGMAVFILNDVLQVYAARLYASGGEPLSSTAMTWFSRSWIVVTTIVTLAYAFMLVKSLRAGVPPNPIKLAFLTLTFLYLGYTAGQIDRPAVGWAMFEMWHDVQYLAIVWVFNLSRARWNPESGGFIQALFRPKAGLAAVYILGCLAFGSLTHSWRLFEDPAAIRIAASIVLATAMLHYYLDGFIWRIREPGTRAALGMASAPGVVTPRRVIPFTVPPALRHAALWLLFVVPAAVLLAMESRPGPGRPPLMVYEELVKTFPDSPHAHFELGRELQELGRLQEGKVHLEKSLALSPNSHPALTRLGALLADQRKPAEARPYLENALRLEPRDIEARNNLAIVLEELGDLEGAKSHLLAALEVDPEYALAHSNLGIVSSRLGDVGGAIQHLREAIRINPENPGTHNTLGETLLKAGRQEEAKKSFQEALKLAPDFALAKRNLEEIGDRVKSVP
jgi:tetratricopeptide (TPR) repeat protein